MRKLPDDEMKIANIKPFGLRLQPGLKDWVETAAKINNRSINAEIVARLEASFVERGGSDAAGEDRFASLAQEIETLRGNIRALQMDVSALKQRDAVGNSDAH